ncbi:MAG: hypothetical protein GY756_12790 [bacterium]|nr:hypothetical protein [bacterium]
MKKETILFFYLNTGNGHLAPARALKEHIDDNLNDKFMTVLVDGLKESLPHARVIMEKGYRKSISTAIWVYELWYLIMLIKPIRSFTLWLISIHVKPYITKIIREEKPDKIVIFHTFIIKPIMDVIKKEGLDIKPQVIITDPYTAHPSWFHYRDLNYVAFSDKVVKKHDINYRKFPIVLNKEYGDRVLELFHLKEDLGFDPNKKLVLIIGGGDGLPRGVQIVKEIVRSSPDCQIAYVCGRNKNQYKKVAKLKKKYQIDCLKVYGFVNNLHELSRVSDIAITKAGASTVMELLMTETVPIITRYIWGQEKGNKDFVVDNNLGFYEKRPQYMPQLIDSLLSDEKIIPETVNNIRNMKITNGTELVANFITNQ